MLTTRKSFCAMSSAWMLFWALPVSYSNSTIVLLKFVTPFEGVLLEIL